MIPAMVRGSPGERLGRYELVALLATGGMGRIYLGRLRGPGGFVRHVVIKTLDLPGEDPGRAKAMFLDEARLLGLLHHQHIAPVYEIAQHDGQLLIVIDYVHGRTAHEVWERTRQLGAALPLDFTLTVAAAAASGLHYAHVRRGIDGEPLHIVHRDVSPSNLMIGFDGAVKLIDFGIAKAADRSVRTQTGFVKGKLGYMAPEQVRQQDVDARTDVFALGIVLYELSTMQRAFAEASDRMTVERIKSGAYVPPSQVVPEFPKELERVIAKALRLDPRERYPDAGAFRRAIDTLGHRFGLVLGDAAITEVMGQLFEDRREPWQRIGARPETDLLVPLEVFAPEDTREAPPPGPHRKSFRSATEVVFALESELDKGGELAVTTPEGVTFPDEPIPELDASALIAEPEPPPGERVAKIERLFTESVFDPTATPPRPLEFDNPGAPPPISVAELAAAPAPPGVDLPFRGNTHRGVGVDTDGVTILPPNAQAAAALAGPRTKTAGGGSARRIAWIAIITILLGGIGIAVFMLVDVDAAADAPSDGGVVVHAPAPAEAGAPVADAATLAVASDAPAVATGDAAIAGAPDGAEVALADPPDAHGPTDAGRSDDAQPAAHQVHLKVVTTPDNATVELDGKRLGKSPFDGPVEVSSAAHHYLKLRLSGYLPIKAEVDLSGDLVREFTMSRLKSDSGDRKPPTPKTHNSSELELPD